MDAEGRTQREPQRASRASAQRAAVDAAKLPGARVVTAVSDIAAVRQRAWDAAAQIVDPEIPVLTIADLGVLREVTISEGHVEVTITPTYSGCPAMNMIALEIALALERAGFQNPKI